MGKELEQLKAAVLDWKASTHRFAWPDDSVCTKPWYYDFHVGWVRAWNDEDRKTDADVFMLKYAESFDFTPTERMSHDHK